MQSNVRSSITLPASELRLVTKLRRRLGAKTNVAVVRSALKLLDETTDREQLRAAFRDAASRVRRTSALELAELDHLAGEGLSE